MGTLLGLVVVSARCSRVLAGGDCLGVRRVATATGLQAGTTIGGDLLPVVLQVGAPPP